MKRGNRLRVSSGTRTLYLHVGLHKTGTTSIQWFFHEHRAYLKSLGLLYPQAGLLPSYPGHHNLAWQLSGDRRFDPRLGTLQSVFAEMAAFDGDVLLSSEDFESSLGIPGRWVPICVAARKSGFQVVPLIFLREQTSYLESLFLQNLVLGAGECFSNDFEDCLRCGQVRKQDGLFHFDYQAMIRCMQQVGFDRILVGCYANGAYHDSLDALIDRIGLKPELMAGLQRFRKNTRRAVSYYLGRFYENRFRLPPAPTERLAILANGLAIPRLNSTMRARCQQRFANGNNELAALFGAGALVSTSAQLEHPGAHATDIHRVFSFESSLWLRQWLARDRAADLQGRSQAPSATPIY